MNCLAVLPDATLPIDSGPIGRHFHSVGVATFHAACAWVRDLPYGTNHGAHRPDALFSERCGTCQSKHDAIAALARELHLPVQKYVGAYRLDESIVEGAGAVLAAHGLTYVPQMHCVLHYDQRFFDLTAGNDHGKRRDITDMDIYFRMEPFAGDAELQAVFELCMQYYRQLDPQLARRTLGELRLIAAQCRMRMPQACAPAV